MNFYEFQLYFYKYLIENKELNNENSQEVFKTI